MKKIKVLIVDDSAVVRQVISALLSNEPDIEVLTPASDPIFAQKKMAVQWPDVIILDVEMPRMDGITFLKQLMAEHPTPVIICSTLTERGAEVTMQALQAGALTIITKPKAGLKDFLQESRQEMLSAVRAAAQAKLENIVKPKPHVLKKVQQTMPSESLDINIEDHTKSGRDRHIYRWDTSFRSDLNSIASSLSGDCYRATYARKIYRDVC
ncbi:response regulator [Vibrio anguillarum]